MTQRSVSQVTKFDNIICDISVNVITCLNSIEESNIPNIINCIKILPFILYGIALLRLGLCVNSFSL